jgi:hypothetical protein
MMRDYEIMHALVPEPAWLRHQMRHRSPFVVNLMS